MNRGLRLIFGVPLIIFGAILHQSCGGSSTSTPTAPSTGSGGTAANVTVAIVGSSGSQAFSPNPVSVPVNQSMLFRNSDSTTHRIVANAGGFDTGNIAPGASSASITITSTTPMPFHCTIHPSMVGTINGTSSASNGSNDPGMPGY